MTRTSELSVRTVALPEDGTALCYDPLSYATYDLVHFSCPDGGAFHGTLRRRTAPGDRRSGEEIEPACLDRPKEMR